MTTIYFILKITDLSVVNHISTSSLVLVIRRHYVYVLRMLAIQYQPVGRIRMPQVMPTAQISIR